MLELVLALAHDMPEAFKRRQTAVLPYKIINGVAIADEPCDSSGDSLSHHRGEFLKDTATRLVSRNARKTGDPVSLFRTSLAVNRNFGVNPQNLAFNK